MVKGLQAFNEAQKAKKAEKERIKAEKAAAKTPATAANTNATISPAAARRAPAPQITPESPISKAGGPIFKFRTGDTGSFESTIFIEKVKFTIKGINGVIQTDDPILAATLRKFYIEF